MNIMWLDERGELVIPASGPWPNTTDTRESVRTMMLADWDELLTPEEAFRLSSFGRERVMPKNLRDYLDWLDRCDQSEQRTGDEPV